ncbi:MAG: hypothetical protein HYY03_06220 [Chloroflexi bacterium]|nr:hypothetical protein [Chloroflexota bacterium]
MRILDVTPTPLYPRSDGDNPTQIARLRLEAEAPAPLTVRVATEDGRSTSSALTVRAGEGTYDIPVPEIATESSLELRLESGGQTRAARTIRCRPARKWTVYVMPTSHIDLYSTKLAHETPEEHAQILDAAVALAGEFAGYRYQIENMLPIFEYRELRSRKQIGRLAEAIRAGRIAFGAQYTGLHQEEALAEELVQGQLLMMRELEAAHDIRPNCGYTVDVPNTTIQYAQLLARCGVSGWIFSPNRYPAPDGWYGLGQSIRRLPRLLRAQGFDGSSVLAWLPHEHYGQDPKRFGLDSDDVEAAAPLVAERLLELEAEGYPWDAYLLEYSYGDNLPPTRALPVLVAAWQKRYAYPRLVLATADQFFGQLDGAAPEPPAMRLEVLDAWAWIIADQGVLNQIARRAGHDLLGAQALWSLRGDDCPAGRSRAAFSDLAKFAAHDWWYGGGQVAGVPDLAKAAWAHAASETASAVLGETLVDRGEGPTPVVLNPCAFGRRDMVVAPAAAVSAGKGTAPCQAVDAATLTTHFRPRPYTIAHPPRGEEAGDNIVFNADLPTLGGEAVHLEHAQPSRRHNRAVLENHYYRVEFEPSAGAVASVIDKEDGRELVDTDQHGSGQLLLGTPQWEGFGIGFGLPHEQAVERMRLSLKSWQPCPLELDHALDGPVFSSLLLRGQVHSSPVTQSIILYEDLKRIDVTISIEWDSQPPASRLVVAFPFALDGFTCQYEVPFGVLTVGRDETPTVPRHLRQLQTWLRFSEGERSIVLASPDVGVFSLGRCDLNPVDDGEYTVPERPTAYFILADNGAPSPLVQPGRLAARFSLTTGRGLRPSDCARFAWGFARPPLLGAEDENPLGPLEVSPDSVLVSAVKRAWDGSGLVVRVVEYDGLAAGATLRLPFAAKRAWLADPVEHPLSPLPVEGREVRFHVKPHEVLTLLIED